MKNFKSCSNFYLKLKCFAIFMEKDRVTIRFDLDEYDLFLNRATVIISFTKIKM